MTRILFSNCILMLLVACSPTNVLTYKHHQYYKEQHLFTNDSIFKFHQTVFYNKPGVIDEEFSHALTISIFDTTALQTKKILDLQKDTSVINVQYGIFSVWNWSDENNKVSGQIQLLKWGSNEVTLKENIYINDYRRKGKKRFSGTRTFKRKDRR